jgi:hypothetical protein
MEIIFGFGWALCLFLIQFRHAGSLKKIFFRMYYEDEYFKDKLDKTDKKLLIAAGILFVLFVIALIRKN